MKHVFYFQGIFWSKCFCAIKIESMCFEKSFMKYVKQQIVKLCIFFLTAVREAVLQNVFELSTILLSVCWESYQRNRKRALSFSLLVSTADVVSVLLVNRGHNLDDTLLWYFRGHWSEKPCFLRFTVSSVLTHVVICKLNLN